ncbi:MAG: nickel/cobalt efflux transporter RcnA [Proteobacteria bacterium]|nr:nickel/cobalt efflux transporter RcnA [Pseudomonadota bacterium]
MPDIVTLVREGVTNPWLYLPLAVVLGALHALEPGHSKSLMAAFIIAIRGTAKQAILLGVAAAIGHSIVVWSLAALGLWLGDMLILDHAEPWLILITGLMIVGLSAQLLRMHRGKVGHHHHDHGHHHHGEGEDHSHAHDGAADEDEDAHAAAHAREIEQKFAGRGAVSGWEIAWFGFTGGLLPCPAAVAVLLICLQIKKFSLGIAMVAAFSLGLAATLVSIGLLAAWGSSQLMKGKSGGWMATWGPRLPLISGSLVLVAGLLITIRGIIAVASI